MRDLSDLLVEGSVFSCEIKAKLIDYIGCYIEPEIYGFVLTGTSMQLGITFRDFKWDREKCFGIRLKELDRLKVTERVLNEFSF
jgi:hypothetical protein